MQLLNVYVEGVRDPSAEGVRRVAAQIAARYGLSTSDLEKRLTQGRFRVKANVDEETAQAFASDLESLGARCSVVAAGGSAAAGGAEPSANAGSTLTGMPPLSDEPGPRVAPAPPPVLARPGALSPAPVLPRTSTLPMTALPLREAAAPSEPLRPPGLASTLANATFGPHGAMEHATFSLAKLDERAAPPTPPAPPAVGRATLMGIPGPLTKAPAPPPVLAASSPPHPTPFAAPPVDAALAFALSPLEAPPRVDDARFSPPADVAPHLLLEAPAPARGALARDPLPDAAPPTAAPYSPSGVRFDDKAGRRRHRVAFTVGIFLSLAIGFAPAHLVAASKERAAYEKIDNRVRVAQSGITTLSEWRALDDVRTARMRDKRGAQQEIALLSTLLWLGMTSALAFAWVRWGLPRLAPLEE